jgi:hypothetical protein
MSFRRDLTEAEERARDELDLQFLNCWDEAWSVGEIGKAFGVPRNVPLGIIHRVHEADPEALKRKPATSNKGSSPYARL